MCHLEWLAGMGQHGNYKDMPLQLWPVLCAANCTPEVSHNTFPEPTGPTTMQRSPYFHKKYNIHYNLIQAELCRDWYIEDITWLLRETSPWVLKNISQVSKEKKRNMFQHQMRNIVSPSCRVIFFLLNKHQGNTKSIHFNISF